MATETRRHPDLFSPAEAAEYLAVTEAQLPTLEKDFGLLSHKVGRITVYFRRDLEATAMRVVGLRVPRELERTETLRIAN